MAVLAKLVPLPWTAQLCFQDFFILNFIYCLAMAQIWGAFGNTQSIIFSNLDDLANPVPNYNTFCAIADDFWCAFSISLYFGRVFLSLYKACWPQPDHDMG